MLGSDSYCLIVGLDLKEVIEANAGPGGVAAP